MSCPINGQERTRRYEIPNLDWCSEAAQADRCADSKARELGMNPKNFGKLDSNRQEQWLLRRFGKLPDDVLSIEQRIALEEKKKADRRESERFIECCAES